MKNSKLNSAANLWQRYAVLIIALFVLALIPAYAEQLTSGVSFAQISFTASNPPEKYSHYGQVSVDFTMLYGEGYINVERYQNGQAAGWVVKNLRVVNGSVLSGFSTMFDLGTSGHQSSFTAYVEYSTTPLADDSPLKNQVPVAFQLGQAEYSVLPPGEASGQMYYEEKGKQEENQWTGKYTFEVTTVKGPPAASVKITQKKGPDNNLDGSYATIPATYDKKTDTFTFDAQHVPYYDKDGNELNKASFKGTFMGGKLNFKTEVDGNKLGGIWIFKAS
jgi:hypothetical protein